MTADPSAAIENLKKELETKNARIKELETKVQYVLADMENTRRLAEVDVSNAKKYAIKEFGKNLLDVADTLSRAIQVIGNSDLQKLLLDHPDDKPSKLLKSMFQGIEMTQSILLKTFEANTIRKVDVQQGTKFDPSVQDALSTVTVTDPKTQTPGTVAMVIKEGYTLADRVLRAAAVAVYVDENGEMEPTPAEENKKQ